MRASARLLFVLGLSLAGPNGAAAQNRPAFEAELAQLRTQLGISSMSAAVVESGTLVWVRHFGISATPRDTVHYPIASLTKPMTAVLAMRLVERTRLSLEAPVDEAGPGVQVRHLLSHTAAGDPGARFLYSSELFDRLAAPLERAAGTTLRAALAAEVFGPAGLRQTSAARDVTPSAGIVSTVEDVARFVATLERGDLLAGASAATMFRPPRDAAGRGFPYALGWFVQTVGGEQVRWHFGQQGDASALLVTVPRRRRAFVLLARTDRLSAPFWLQLGDVRWSPAAVAFLTTWARMRLDLSAARRTMLGALAAFGAGDRKKAVADARRALVLGPALGNMGDPAMLAAFARSGDHQLREAGRRVAQRLLAADANHPRTLLDVAVLERQDGHPDEAGRLLQKILADRLATPEIAGTARELLAEVRDL